MATLLVCVTSILLFVYSNPTFFLFKCYHVPMFKPGEQQDAKLLQLLREHVEGFAFCDSQLQQILSHAERLESGARQWMELHQRCSWAWRRLIQVPRYAKTLDGGRSEPFTCIIHTLRTKTRRNLRVSIITKVFRQNSSYF